VNCPDPDWPDTTTTTLFEIVFSLVVMIDVWAVGGEGRVFTPEVVSQLN
jgi:hypothetical protein